MGEPEITQALDTWIRETSFVTTLPDLLNQLQWVQHLNTHHESALIQTIRDAVVRYFQESIYNDSNHARSFVLRSSGLQIIPRHVHLRIFAFNSVLTNFSIAYTNRFYHNMITNPRNAILQFQQLTLMNYDHKFIATQTDYNRMTTYDKKFLTSKRQRLLWRAVVDTKRIEVEDVRWLSDVQFAPIISSAKEVRTKFGDTLSRLDLALVSNFVFRDANVLVPLDGNLDVIRHTEQRVNFPKLNRIVLSPGRDLSALAWGADLVVMPQRSLLSPTTGMILTVRTQWNAAESTAQTVLASEGMLQEKALEEEVGRQTEYLRDVVKSLESKLNDLRADRENQIRDLEYEHYQFMENVQLQHEQRSMEVRLDNETKIRDLKEQYEKTVQGLVESKIRLIQEIAIHMNNIRSSKNGKVLTTNGHSSEG